MNPIFQTAIIKSILDYRVKCPRCGHQYLGKNKKRPLTCKHCGYKIPPAR